MRYRMKSSIRWTRTSEGGILVNVTSGASYRVNKVGALIMADLVEGSLLEDIVSQLCAIYRTSEGSLGKDVEAFTNTLRRMDIIEAYDMV